MGTKKLGKIRQAVIVCMNQHSVLPIKKINILSKCASSTKKNRFVDKSYL